MHRVNFVTHPPTQETSLRVLAFLYTAALAKTNTFFDDGKVQHTLTLVLAIFLTHASPVLAPLVKVLPHCFHSVRRALGLGAEESLISVIRIEVCGTLRRVVMLVWRGVRCGRRRGMVVGPGAGVGFIASETLWVSEGILESQE